MTREQNKVEAFCRALARSEQLLTAAGLTDNDRDRWVWTSWASAIASEWCMNEDLRMTIAEAARENVRLGRVGAGEA